MVTNSIIFVTGISCFLRLQRLREIGAMGLSPSHPRLTERTPETPATESALANTARRPCDEASDISSCESRTEAQRRTGRGRNNKRGEKPLRRKREKSSRPSLLQKATSLCFILTSRLCIRINRIDEEGYILHRAGS
ncbi:hypothetical protein TGCAST_206605 [Toxoplasma gondii CAST]|uniref:Uncharacterized protein n=1 Tax=Toxoplasma gondii CAST TaxID=943122 RepID=A0A425I2I8_TOXGO|nr:hypothetical protein TGCAST_206605 [Toxoplasma gondii CAST]